MEEVDGIILHYLRQIGCEIDTNITSLSSITAEMVVEAVVKCLKTIKPDLEISSKLPSNMAARVGICSSLATDLKNIGYHRSVGYQTFLYHSDEELRRLLLFLIEKFPKDEKIEEESVNELTLLRKSVAAVLSETLSEPWLPYYCHKHEHKFTGHTKVPYDSIRLDVPSTLKNDDDCNNYYKHYQKLVPQQVKDNENILPSVISHNAKLFYSRPTNVIDWLDWVCSHQHRQSTTDDVILSYNKLFDIVPTKSNEVSFAEERQPEIKSPEIFSPMKDTSAVKEETIESEAERISTECDKIRLNMEKVQGEIEKLNEKFSQITLIQQSEYQELAVLEEQKKIIARSYDLLSDGDTNIEKLEQVIETKRCKLINLATEWEERRKPLIQKYRDLKENNSSKIKVDEIRSLREKQDELSRELRNKEQKYVQLASEIQKVSKDTSRSAYTQRILEIINNINKQKDEIEKVINDTRNIKKEINNLTGRLERSFAVTKELLQHKILLDLLKTMHANFNSLIDYVEKTGSLIRENRELEVQIDTESAKNVQANLERITADLKQMKQEYADLSAQLDQQKKLASEEAAEPLDSMSTS